MVSFFHSALLAAEYYTAGWGVSSLGIVSEKKRMRVKTTLSSTNITFWEPIIFQFVDLKWKKQLLLPFLSLEIGLGGKGGISLIMSFS